nr:hypothetical protein [Chlamydiota bacterium]
IIIAALRRWPFRLKHIPFLTAHVGLIMILTGTLIKSYWGTQGAMLLVEGSGNDQIIVAQSGVLSLEDRLGKIYKFPIKNQTIDSNDLVELINFYPHHEFKYALLNSVQSDDVEKEVEKAFSEGLRVQQVSRENNKIIDENLNFDTQLNFSKEKGFDQPKILVDNITIPLDGSLSLLNQSDGHQSVRVEIERPSTFLLLNDNEGDHYLVFFDEHGRVDCDIFRHNELSTIVVYEEGYGGYAVQSTFEHEKLNLVEKEESQILALKEDLQLAFAEAEQLTPPIELLRSGCQDNFCDQFVQFLIDWDKSNEWIYPYEKQVDWSLISQDQLNAAYWSMILLDQLNEDNRDKAPWKYLCVSGSCPEQSLIEQMFAISETLPNDYEIKPEESTRLITILLRAYGIHLRTLLRRIPPQTETITLESPLIPKFKVIPPLKKLEDNRPLITVKIEDKVIPVGYDPYSTSLKWPILGGKYLIQYRPEFLTIPYHVRLREGCQIDYPDSQQTFSYECDLIVTGETSEEISLSMNHVHQTWDGYRFYLANVTTSDGHSAKKVQLIVNHDPARYVLTYPGGGIVAMGIVLLFWLRPYRRK